MIMGISISYISSVIIFADLMLTALEAVFRIAQNNNVTNVIPNENTNFVFKCSEFESSEFECFGLILHSSITVSISCMDTLKCLHQHGVHQSEKTRSS